MWKGDYIESKQKILLYHVKDNLSQKEIHRITGVAGDTIRKYVREYEEKLPGLNAQLTYNLNKFLFMS